MKRGSRLGRGLGLLLVGLLWGSGCKKAKLDEDHLIEKPLGAMSQWGVEMQFRVVNDPLMVSFVQGVGETYLPYVQRKNVPYRFTVLNTGMVNAFAIPWGGVYVTRGLLEFADTEDEVAFVIGHEIGHVEGRHSVKQFKTQVMVGLGLSALENRQTRSWVRALQVASFFAFLKYGRDQEFDADRRGAEFSFEAAYDPRGGTAFFRKLQDRYGDQPRLLVWLSTHPLTRDRIARLEASPQLDFNTATVNRRVGMGYLRRGMFHQAQECFLAALKRDARDAASYAGLAQAYFSLGRQEEAREALRRAEALDRRNPTVRQAAQVLAKKPPALLASAAPLGPSPDWETVERSMEEARAFLRAQTERSKVASERLGSQADGLRQWMAKLAALPSTEEAVETSLAQAEKLLTLAEQTLAEVLSAQENALDALAWAEKVHRWGTQWQGPPRRLGLAFQEARRGLEDLQGALRELPAVTDSTTRTVGEVYRALENFSQGLRREQPVFFLETDLLGLEQRLERAWEQAARTNQTIAVGRCRMLRAAIEGIVAHATEQEQTALVPLFAHLLRAEEGQVRSLWESGLQPGEVALLLAGAKSSRLPVEELHRRLERTGDSLALLTESGASLWAVEVSLNLLANALERELRPEERRGPRPPASEEATASRP